VDKSYWYSGIALPVQTEVAVLQKRMRHKWLWLQSASLSAAFSFVPFYIIIVVVE
jgi:hypothetical protein